MSPAKKEEPLPFSPTKGGNVIIFKQFTHLIQIKNTLPQSFQGPNTERNMINRLHPDVDPEPSWSLRAEEPVRISGNVVISKGGNKFWSD